jgi:hypothetical protein
MVWSSHTKCLRKKMETHVKLSWRSRAKRLPLPPAGCGRLPFASARQYLEKGRYPSTWCVNHAGPVWCCSRRCWLSQLCPLLSLNPTNQPIDLDKRAHRGAPHDIHYTTRPTAQGTASLTGRTSLHVAMSSRQLGSRTSSNAHATRFGR